MKDKSKVLKTYRDKLQFVYLIGGRALTWGRRVPASALPTWGSIPQIGNTWISDIHVFVSQGIEPWLTNADAGTRLLKKAPM